MARDPSASLGVRIADLLERYGAVVAFVVLFAWNAGLGALIFCSDSMSDQAAVFRRPENLRNILNQNAFTGIVAVGMTLVIVSGGIDLAVGSVMALSAAVALQVSNALMAAEWSESSSVALGIAAGLGTATACGCINGALVTVGRLPSFIATLGGFVAYRSVALARAEGGEIRSSSATILSSLGSGGIPLPDFLSGGRSLTITWNILLFLLVAAIGQVLLSRSRFGRHLIAVGGNETAARYSAIAVNRVRFAAFVIVSICAGLAGLMSAARMNSVSSSQLGANMELDAIAAVVIGGTSMAGGKGRVWGTVVGVLILAIINNMLVVAQYSVYWQGFVKGVIIVLAVLIQRGRRA